MRKTVVTFGLLMIKFAIEDGRTGGKHGVSCKVQKISVHYNAICINEISLSKTQNMNQINIKRNEE